MALPSIQLGPYQLHERIGEGGSGQVYRATGPTGTVAIKLVGNPADLDEATLARCRREIAALRELAHPSLIALVDHGVDAELGPYLVLPLLAGPTLRRLLDGRGVCPEAAILFVLPIAEATAALHARGFVHRDLKPENAIATPDGTITVIDLGLAWGEHMTRQTESGAAVGSIGYMSPEQLEGRAVGSAADVWAIGVMLYEAIAGKRPFARPRPTEEVAATLLGSCARLTASDRRASEELAELVAQCLGLDATKRPTLAEVVTRLRAMIDWTDDVTVERAAAIANPADYQARVAAFRVRRLERTAREALAAGKPFLALAHCDRGLAYTPDDATFVSLIAEAESSTAPAKRRHVWWIVGGVIAMAVALGYAMYERTDDDPWQARRSTVPTTPVDHGDGDVRDKALLRDVMGLFGKALDAAKTAPPVSVQHATPTTALGWLARAKTQQPADAVVSLRHALSLSPDWPEAQDLLCATLAATKDDTAIDVCTTSIERDATNVAVRAARGLALVDANRHADALADLDVVIAADPAPRWRRVRATARAASGDQRGAQQDLANACELGDAIACQARR